MHLRQRLPLTLARLPNAGCNGVGLVVNFNHFPEGSGCPCYPIVEKINAIFCTWQLLTNCLNMTLYLSLLSHHVSQNPGCEAPQSSLHSVKTWCEKSICILKAQGVKNYMVHCKLLIVIYLEEYNERCDTFLGVVKKIKCNL